MDYKRGSNFPQKLLPKRPDDGGKSGLEIPVVINFLDMKINPMKVFMYYIKLTKAETFEYGRGNWDSTRKMKSKEIILKVLREFLRDKEGAPVFDGFETIFSNKLLPFPEEPTSTTFNYFSDGAKTICYFTINRVNKDIELNNLNKYVESVDASSDDMPQDELRALDAIMKEMLLSKDLITIDGNEIFNPSTLVSLDCGPYVMIDRYEMKVRPQMRKIRLNFNEIQIVCHEPINLLDYIKKIVPLDQLNSRIIFERLQNLRVEAGYFKTREGKKYTKKFTIIGFSEKSANEERSRRGQTFVRFYQDQFNIVLRYPNLKMIKTKGDEDNYIPIELLTVLPFQNVHYTEKDSIPEYVRYPNIPIEERLEKIRNDIRNLEVTNSSNKFLKNYEIEIDPNFINVRGRILDSFENQNIDTLSSEISDLRIKQLAKPYDKVVNWALICVGQEQDYKGREQYLRDLETQLPKAAQQAGIKMEPMYQFAYVHNYNIERDVTQIVEQSKKEGKSLDFLYFIVISNADYRAVKIFGDITYGIATRCMRYTNFTEIQNFDEYLDSVILDINVKLGGLNNELNVMENDMFKSIKPPYIIFGIDLRHPDFNRNDLPISIAALIGSIDHNLIFYNTVIYKQDYNKKNRNVIFKMKDMVYKLLKGFCDKNINVKPEHLIFYRKNILEDKFQNVFHHDIADIKSACEKLETGYQPPITYIVANKCYGIQFFPTLCEVEDEVEKSENCPSSVVIDTDITHLREFDFYLYVRDRNRNIPMSNHFHVLFDENKWESDELQKFTYNLYKGYNRSNKTITSPAPLYYASRMASRGRVLVGKRGDDNIGIASGRFDYEESEIFINEYHNEKYFFT